MASAIFAFACCVVKMPFLFGNSLITKKNFSSFGGFKVCKTIKPFGADSILRFISSSLGKTSISFV